MKFKIIFSTSKERERETERVYNDKCWSVEMEMGMHLQNIISYNASVAVVLCAKSEKKNGNS